MSEVQRRPPVQDGHTAGVDLKRGAIFGAGAWAFGIVFTAILSWIEFQDTASALESLSGTGEVDELSEFLPSAFDTVGFMFYNAHFVDVGFDYGVVGLWINLVRGSVDVTGLVMSQATTGQLTWATDLERLLEALGGTVPTVVWLLVPVGTLVWGGYMVASRTDVSDSTEGAKAGASVVVGYSVLAVAGTFLFSWHLSPSGEMAEITIKPRLTMAAGLMGLVYPAVFGGIGGWVAARTGAGQRQSRPNPGDARSRGPRDDPPANHQRAPERRHGSQQRSPPGQRPQRGGPQPDDGGRLADSPVGDVESDRGSEQSSPEGSGRGAERPRGSDDRPDGDRDA